VLKDAENSIVKVNPKFQKEASEEGLVPFPLNKKKYIIPL